MLATNKRRSIPGLVLVAGWPRPHVRCSQFTWAGLARPQHRRQGTHGDMWRVVLTLAVNCSLNLQMQHVVSGAELGHSLPELEMNLRKI